MLWKFEWEMYKESLPEVTWKKKWKWVFNVSQISLTSYTNSVKDLSRSFSNIFDGRRFVYADKAAVKKQGSFCLDDLLPVFLVREFAFLYEVLRDLRPCLPCGEQLYQRGFWTRASVEFRSVYFFGLWQYDIGVTDSISLVTLVEFRAQLGSVMPLW